MPVPVDLLLRFFLLVGDPVGTPGATPVFDFPTRLAYSILARDISMRLSFLFTSSASLVIGRLRFLASLIAPGLASAAYIAVRLCCGSISFSYRPIWRLSLLAFFRFLLRS
jgi:hypothetical protein